MLSLISGHHPCFLFNYLFLQSLFVDIRIVLLGQHQQELCQLAWLADTLWLTCTEHSAILYIESTGIVGKKQKSIRIDPDKKMVCAFIPDIFGRKCTTVFSLVHSRKMQRPVIVSDRDNQHL